MIVEGRRKRPANETLIRYRYSARQRGLEFDLDLAIVKELLALPCEYCGLNDLMITLDRTENSLGYLKTNVVPACIRCNILKADMPKEAWLRLAPAVKEIACAGVFGSWIGRNLKVGRQDITR
jgi:hypothetical protein